MNKEQIKKYCDLYNSTGRIAYYHPKLKTISLNGGRMQPEELAIKKIKQLLNK